MKPINYIYNFKRRLLWAMGLLGVIASVCGQQIVTEVEEAPEQASKVCFVALGSVRERLFKNLYYLSKGKYRPVHASFAQRGLKLPFTPESTFTLYRKVLLENGETEMRSIFDPLPAPDRSDSYLVFLVQLGDELRALILDDSLKAHPVDHVRFHNFSSNELKGSVNAEFVNLDPYKTVLLPFDAKEHTHLNINFSAKDVNDTWRPSYRRSLQLLANRRINVVALNRPGGNEKRRHVLLTFLFLEHISPER